MNKEQVEMLEKALINTEYDTRSNAKVLTLAVLDILKHLSGRDETVSISVARPNFFKDKAEAARKLMNEVADAYTFDPTDCEVDKDKVILQLRDALILTSHAITTGEGWTAECDRLIQKTLEETRNLV